MSLNFYRELLARITVWDSLIIPILTTSIIALAVYQLLISVASTSLNYWAKRKVRTKGHEPMFVASVLVLAALLCLEVYTNLSGVEYVSKLTTKPVVESGASDVFAEVNSEIAKQENLRLQLLSGELGGYGWFADDGFHLNRSGKAFQQIIADDISQLRAQQKQLLLISQQSHQDDQIRYSHEVKQKRLSLSVLVWFAYPITFLIAFITSHYTDQVLAHIARSEMGNASPISPVSYSISTKTLLPDIQQKLQLEAMQGGNATPLAESVKLASCDIAYLAKWQEAVDLILQGHSNRAIQESYVGPQGSIGGTTIQKLKTVLRAHGLLPEYQSN